LSDENLYPVGLIIQRGEQTEQIFITRMKNTLTKVTNRITDGTLISTEVDRAIEALSSSLLATPLTISTIARFAPQMFTGS